MFDFVSKPCLYSCIEPFENGFITAKQIEFHACPLPFVGVFSFAGYSDGGIRACIENQSAEIRYDEASGYQDRDFQIYRVDSDFSLAIGASSAHVLTTLATTLTEGCNEK